MTSTRPVSDIRRIGRVGAKTLGYYLFTLVSALLLAFATGLAFKPGAGLTPDLKGKRCGGAWVGVVQALPYCSERCWLQMLYYGNSAISAECLLRKWHMR